MTRAPIDSFVDTFDDVRPPGGVKGTTTADGTRRLVVDAEDHVSIDRGALRFAPNRQEGWAREGISYGPFEHRPGLVFAVYLLNGHNGSHSGPIDGGLRRRFSDWVLGPRDRTIARRMVDFARSGRKRESLWLWRWWLSNAPRFASGESIGDNLAVGWFDGAAPIAPFDQGMCIGVRTNEGETGRVIATVGTDVVGVVPVVLNVPTYYAVLATARGASFYAASIEGVQRLGVLPTMQPLAVQRSVVPPTQVYAGVHQSVLGQVGFSADTRVYATAARVVADWSEWWSTAHVADSLAGTGSLGGSQTEHGGFVWQTSNPAGLERTPNGAVQSGDGRAHVDAGRPSGLLAVGLRPERPSKFGLVFRRVDDRNCWFVEVDGGAASLVIVVDGDRQTLARTESVMVEASRVCLLQVADDGSAVSVRLDGHRLFGIDGDRRHADGVGVGVLLDPTAGSLFDFEAHPRAIDTNGLATVDLTIPSADNIVLADRFDGVDGDLDGRQVAAGVAWRRAVGSGRVEVVPGRGAVVQASVTSPNPGRTLYLLPWSNTGFAEVDVEICPPGTTRNEGHKGRAGIVFWQDEDHYLIVNNWLDDTYPGASLSLFCRLGPFEEIFRAVWSNVGRRIDWGVRHRLRIVFNGVTIVARIDDEVVLHRGVPDVHDDVDRLVINELGLAVNWEWGNDTGSVFSDFVARS